jgi:Ca2+-dependent lipid-binding protein
MSKALQETTRRRTTSFNLTLLRRECYSFASSLKNKSFQSLPKQVQIDDIHRQHSTVEILLKRGVNLASRDFNGFSDPYCILFIQKKAGDSDSNSRRRKKKLKSSVIKKNLNPEWNEVFDFSVDCDSSGNVLDELRIECWDQDFLLKDDFLVSNGMGDRS